MEVTWPGLEVLPRMREIHILHDDTVRVIELPPDEQVSEAVEPTHGAILVEMSSDLLNTEQRRRALAKLLLEAMRPGPQEPCM